MTSNLASIVALNALPGVDMDMKEDWPYALPLRYVVREIDCTLTGAGLEFSFRNPQPAQLMPTGVDPIGQVVDLVRLPSSTTVTSRFAPLDVGAKGDSLMIFFKIVGPANMRFSATKKALTHKNADDRDYYGRLRHANATTVSEQPLPDCRIAFFVVDPAHPPADEYRHDFSLNVEIDQAGNEGPRTIAFEIDPDIRYPGGSVTE